MTDTMTRSQTTASLLPITSASKNHAPHPTLSPASPTSTVSALPTSPSPASSPTRKTDADRKPTMDLHALRKSGTGLTGDQRHSLTAAGASSSAAVSSTTVTASQPVSTPSTPTAQPKRRSILPDPPSVGRSRLSDWFGKSDVPSSPAAAAAAALSSTPPTPTPRSTDGALASHRLSTTSTMDSAASYYAQPPSTLTSVLAKITTAVLPSTASGPATLADLEQSYPSTDDFLQRCDFDTALVMGLMEEEEKEEKKKKNAEDEGEQSGAVDDFVARESPSFRRLHANASEILSRFQNEYVKKTISLRKCEGEREAEREAKEQLERRIRRLEEEAKFMARQIQQQSESIQRYETAMSSSSSSSIPVLGHPSCDTLAPTVTPPAAKVSSNDSTLHSVSEDGDDASTVDDVSTLDNASIFSQPAPASPSRTARSSPGPDDQPSNKRESLPATTTTTTSTTTTTPSTSSSTLASISASSSSATTPPTFSSSSTTSSSTTSPPPAAPSKWPKLWGGGGSRTTTPTCDTCRKSRAGDMVATLDILREENRGLKGRVVQLEAAIEGALDLTCGIGGIRA